jgi:hypothetical protein
MLQKASKRSVKLLVLVTATWVAALPPGSAQDLSSGASVAAYPAPQLPGLVPEVFAPGVVSSSHQEHSAPTVSPDGREIYWSIWMLPRTPDQPPQMIRFIRRTVKSWSEPATAPFSGTYMDGGPCFSPDGKRLVFYSTRPLPGSDQENQAPDLWYVEREGDGWSSARPLGVRIGETWIEGPLSISENGNLYFGARDATNRPTWDIYLSRFHNGRYGPPEKLGGPINTESVREYLPCIAADESFLIFAADSRRFGENGERLGGKRTLMISFRADDGRWQEPLDMGPVFNDRGARFPGLSPDGEVLFFTRYVDPPNEDIFWVDAAVIDKLR